MPDQNASMADPFNFSVIIGSAMLSDVASSAAANVMIQIEPKANINAVVGLNSGGVLVLSKDEQLELSLASGTMASSFGGLDGRLVSGEGLPSIDKDVVDMVGNNL